SFAGEIMRPERLILRSPPFPGARPAARAISLAGDTPLDSILAACSRAELTPAERERAATLRSAMIAGRVGGSFWEPPAAQGITAPNILRPANLAQARSMLEDLPPPSRCLAV